LTAIFTFGVFLVGRSADTLSSLPAKMFGESVRSFGKLLAHIFPNLQAYVPPRPLLLGQAANTSTWAFVGQGALHAVCYAAVLIALAAIVFRKRDFL
jgi:hypothetical protein